MSAPNVSTSLEPCAGTDRSAIGLILLAMPAFSAQDVMIKLALAEASVWQTQLIRSLAVVALELRPQPRLRADSPALAVGWAALSPFVWGLILATAVTSTVG